VAQRCRVLACPAHLTRFPFRRPLAAVSRGSATTASAGGRATTGLMYQCVTTQTLTPYELLLHARATPPKSQKSGKVVKQGSVYVAFLSGNDATGAVFEPITTALTARWRQFTESFTRPAGAGASTCIFLAMSGARRVSRNGTALPPGKTSVTGTTLALEQCI
jgi:hypothetical protein